MENREMNDPQEIQIQGVLDRYLRSRTAAGDDALPSAAARHLDEDSLTAFTEGRLTTREAQPLVRHLADCSFCRHVTAELIKLDAAFAVADAPTAVSDGQPSKISEVLGNLLSRIFGGAGDNAVFAHEEKEDDSEKTKDAANREK